MSRYERQEIPKALDTGNRQAGKRRVLIPYFSLIRELTYWTEAGRQFKLLRKRLQFNGPKTPTYQRNYVVQSIAHHKWSSRNRKQFEILDTDHWE